MPPTTGAERRLVSVAISRGATILSREVALDPAQADALAGVLDHLTRLGLVACHTLSGAQEAVSADGFMDALRPHVGREALAAVVAAGPPAAEKAPAFLCSVWPFHGRDGELAAAAQFLGLDMVFEARASADEETGFYLPGRDEPLLASARAHCSALRAD